MKCLAKLGEIWYAVLVVGIFVAASIKAGLARRSSQEKQHHRWWDDEPAIVKFGEVLGLILALLAVVVVVAYCLRS